MLKLYQKLFNTQTLQTPAPDTAYNKATFFEGELKKLYKKADLPEKEFKVLLLEALENFKANEQGYIICQNENDFKNLLVACENSELIAFDFETSGFDIIQDYPVGLSIAPQPGLAYYLPLAHKQVGLDTYRNLDNLLIRKWLKKVFSLRKTFVAHHAKFDLAFLQKLVQVPARIEDTYILQKLIDVNAPAKLKVLAKKYLEVEPTTFEETTGKKKAQDTPIVVLGKYCCADSDYTLRLFPILEKRLERLELKEVYELELKVMKVLLGMEVTGVLISEKKLRQARENVNLDVLDYQKQIHRQLGKQINLNSPSQLLTALQALGIFIENTEGKTLKTLKGENEVIPIILEYREKTKLLNTYLKGLPRHIKPSTGRVHTSYNQFLVTGRIISKNPNLQQLPKSKGAKELIRGSLIASPGYKLVSIDYSQMELRVLAHFSQEPKLLRAYLEGEDIHQKTADLVNIPRQQAKVVNFGIIYGMTSKGLASTLEISEEEAEDFIEKYFKIYPGVKAWKSETILKAREEGFVETISGRKRALPGLNDYTPWKRKAAEREAVNTVIQGSSADIMKKALVQVAEAMEVYGEKVRLLLPVHDELLIEVKESLISEVVPVIMKIMASAWKLKVPLEVEAEVGNNWGDMKEFQPSSAIVQTEVFKTILGIIRKIEKQYGTAKLSEILVETAKHGINKKRIDVALKQLKAEGVIYEPKIEEFRRI